MTEQRLIDANALKNFVSSKSTHWLNDWSTLGVLAAVDKQPTIDAVPVVRCKECRYVTTEDGGFYCYGPIGIFGTVGFNDFCSFGERKEQ